jgi:hypothetical protein
MVVVFVLVESLFSSVLHGPTSGQPDVLMKIILAVFSWIVLMPISVIVAGILLAKRFKLSGKTRNILRVPIPPVLVLEATGDAVILGFIGFILTLCLLALLDGPDAYLIVKVRFGVDPGQFDALCMLSAFGTVVWAVILTLLLMLLTQIGIQSQDPTAKTYAQRIDTLNRRRQHTKGE